MEEKASIGAIIGCGLCLAVSWGSSPLMVSLAAIGGFSVGSVIGVFVWFSSLEFPDEPIVAPFPADERPWRHGFGGTVGAGRRTATTRSDWKRAVCCGYQRFAALRQFRIAENRSPASPRRLMTGGTMVHQRYLSERERRSRR